MFRTRLCDQLQRLRRWRRPSFFAVTIPTELSHQCCVHVNFWTEQCTFTQATPNYSSCLTRYEADDRGPRQPEPIPNPRLPNSVQDQLSWSWGVAKLVAKFSVVWRSAMARFSCCFLAHHIWILGSSQFRGKKEHNEHYNVPKHLRRMEPKRPMHISLGDNARPQLMKAYGFWHTRE